MSSRLRQYALIAMMVLLILPSMASGAAYGKPIKTTFVETFNGLDAWSSFGLLASDEPAAKAQKSLPLLQLYDASGKSVATALWDGSEPRISKDGREWLLTLSAQIGFKKLSFEIKSIWSDNTKLALGRAEVTVTSLSDKEDSAKYRYALRFPGAGAWTSKDGLSAAISTPVVSSSKVYEHAALSVMDASCTFKSRQIEKLNSSKQQKKLFFIEATSNAIQTGEESKALIMGIYLTVVEAWSYEPVMDLAVAMTSGISEPDVRIFGTADKQAASPGESLEYTYYLINVGMDKATDLNVTIPISENTGLIAASINGSPGKAKLMPSGEEVEVTPQRSDSKSADRGVQSFQWRPKDNLKPGETIYISFSVII